MLQKKSNAQRSKATRAALIASARTLFVEHGFAETGTPEIVKNADVTRGALYHHFADKTDLFRAVIAEEAEAVAEEIARNAAHSESVIEGIINGSDAYFRAMAVPGRARLLLIDGPSVLGQKELHDLDKVASHGELRRGLEAAMKSGVIPQVSVRALANILAAAFDRTALLANANPETYDDYIEAMRLLVRSLVSRPAA